MLEIEKNKEKELVRLAIEASKSSYSPYSNFTVGAAILCDDGTIYTGSNIENASYGAAICAERTAAVQAVHENHKRFLAVAVFGAHRSAQETGLQYAFPCGICRQFLNEFADKDMVVLIAKSEDDYIKRPFKDILPESFGPEDLNMETV